MQKELAVGRYCCERYFLKELELDKDRKLQKREEKCKTKREQIQKDEKH